MKDVTSFSARSPSPGRPRAKADDLSLAEEAYALLTDEIVGLAIPPGSLVSEWMLSEKLGIGRTPIREALKLLARDYLVTLLPKRGVLVSSIDAHQMMHVLETRRCLEPTRYARAARRGTAADRAEIERLAGLLDHAAAAVDFREQVRIDILFDNLVDRCAANPFLTDTLKPLHGIVRRFWNQHAGTAGYDGIIGRHTALVRAVASGDPDRATAACAAMLDYNEVLLRAMLD
ncbi:GntR family transcriptional regulator [Bosea sp. (in: a-proteobacteria)]|uniref:GntR family transcriptional regulator n=1 Tax=Bosea sp. (in: a-proteobacteria) TaxID=1871050 RepID=UPI0026091277|nr:GntR family transcriptional regulator [Bosea sp. (in: a-proteobacteria)]MCO5089806.1 GntR family transcriptional regulator [Bosea sp. (in: a-proteobacteria)]